MNEISHSRNPEAHATEPIYVKMYYEHQYEALARISNYGIWVTLTILSLSILVVLFAFNTEGKRSIVVWLGAPLLMVAANSFAIIFLKQVRMGLGNMHIERAKAVLRCYAPELLELEQASRPGMVLPQRSIRRIIPPARWAQLLLHGCLVVFFLLVPLIYYFS